MKTSWRWLAVAVAAGLLAGTSALAGECCQQTARDVRAGKACEQCVKDQCCKDTAKRIAGKGKAQTCATCAAKSKASSKQKKKS